MSRKPTQHDPSAEARLKETFARNLSAAGKRRRMTQGDVAERTSVSERISWRYEKVRMWPSVETLQRIVIVLDVSADMLFGTVREKTEGDRSGFATGGSVMVRRLPGGRWNAGSMLGHRGGGVQPSSREAHSRSLDRVFDDCAPRGIDMDPCSLVRLRHSDHVCSATKSLGGQSIPNGDQEIAVRHNPLPGCKECLFGRLREWQPVDPCRAGNESFELGPRGVIRKRRLIPIARDHSLKLNVRRPQLLDEELISAGCEARKSSPNGAAGDLLAKRSAYPFHRPGIAQVLVTGNPDDQSRPSFTRLQ